MIKLSASSIKDFLRCSKRYFYRMTEPENALDTEEIVIGNAVHSVLETAWDKSLPEQTFLLNDILSHYDMRDNETALRCLENYHSLEMRSKFSSDDLIEFRFSQEILPDVWLNGRIDRALPNHHVVLDWKTGSVRSKQIDNDPQFIIYYLMYHRVFGSYPNVFLVSLAKGDVIPFRPRQEYITALLHEIIPDMVTKIRAKMFVREGLFNGSCFSCAFTHICEG